jgi:hypothetical protein
MKQYSDCPCKLIAVWLIGIAAGFGYCCDPQLEPNRLLDDNEVGGKLIGHSIESLDLSEERLFIEFLTQFCLKKYTF